MSKLPELKGGLKVVDGTLAQFLSDFIDDLILIRDAVQELQDNWGTATPPAMDVSILKTSK